MRRRNEAKAAEEAAVAEVEARDRASRAEAEGKDAARAVVGPKLAEWAHEPSGRKKDIRALLATMQVRARQAACLPALFTAFTPLPSPPERPVGGRQVGGRAHGQAAHPRAREGGRRSAPASLSLPVRAAQLLAPPPPPP